LSLILDCHGKRSFCNYVVDIQGFGRESLHRAEAGGSRSVVALALTDKGVQGIIEANLLYTLSEG
jgi:hypothetical protein